MYGKGPTPNEANANLLNTFDFSEIDSLDPSLSKSSFWYFTLNTTGFPGEGFKIIYEKDLPFHIR